MSTASVSIPVPSSGFGAAVDVSALVGEKTVALSGRYRGAYVLYGSHDGSRFAPLLIFNAGGIEGIKQTFRGSFAWLKLKSLATGATGVSANVSGLSVLGDNSFASLGVGTVLDLGNDAYQVDLNFMGFGQVNGAVVVEGSLDGIGFNPIGEFASTGVGASLLGGGSGIEFSPVVTNDRVRYVRLNVQGSAGLGFVVTVGGAQSESGGTGGTETLAAAYAVGVSSVDQTMIVAGANGGKVVFDGTGLTFPDQETVEILGQSGYGSLTLGPRNIGIGLQNNPVQFVGPNFSCIAIGRSTVVNAGDFSIAIGLGQVGGNVGGNAAISLGASQALSNFSVAIGTAKALGQYSVSIGTNAYVGDDNGISIGDLAHSEGDCSICIGAASGTGDSSSFDNISLGHGAVTANPGDAWGSSNVAIGAGAITAITNGSVSIGSGANTTGHDNVFHTDVGLIAIGYGADVNSMGASIGIGNGATVHNSSFTSTDEPSIGIGDGVSSVGAGGTVVVGASAFTQSNRTVTCGLRASTLGDGSMALGYNSAAGGVDEAPDAIAIGDSSRALNDLSIAIGGQTTSQDQACVVLGYHSSVGNGDTTGVGGVVIGVLSSATGVYDVVIGRGTQSVNGGGSNVVIGSGASAQGTSEIAIGSFAQNPTVGGAITVSIGDHAEGRDNGCVSIGYSAHSGNGDQSAPHSVALGSITNATGFGAIAIGYFANTGVTENDWCIAIGGAAVSTGTDSISIGSDATSSGASSVAVGNHSHATGAQGGSCGFGNTAHALDSGCVSVGFFTTAGVGDDSGHDSVVVGSQSTATGTADIVIGLQTRAINGGGANVVLGNGALSQGTGEVMIGQNSGNPSGGPYPVGNFHTVAVGFDSAALDTDSVAIGPGAIAGVGDGSAQVAIAIGRQSQAVGYYAVALGPYAMAELDGIAIGVFSKAYEDGDIAIGNGAYTDNSDASHDHNIAMGVGAYTVGSFSGVAVGLDANVGSRQGVAIGTSAKTDSNDSISIGTQASCTLPEITGAGQCVAIGYGASAYRANSIAMGYNARTGELSEQNVVIGANSVINDTDVYSNNVLVGLDVTAVCNSSISIGGTSTIGDVSIVSTDDLSIGPSSACFGSYDVALGSGASVGTNFPLVTPFDYGTALGSRSSVMGQYGVAVGYESSVNGDNGIAIGYLASAGAGEIVFSSSTAGGANKFEVVGSTAGNPDLFKFDVSAMLAGLDSSMFLLYKDTGGFVVCNQVKVQAVTGYLYVPA